MKTITKGKYTLEYDRYIDEWGFERDSFTLIETQENGHRVHIPFMGDMKVSDKRRDFPINKIPYDYTDEDLQKMIDAQIGRYENRP